MAARFRRGSGECLFFHLSREFYPAGAKRFKRRCCAILPIVRRDERLFLHSASMTIGAGEIRVFGVDVKEVMALEIYLLELFAVALREDQVAGPAIARLNRCFAISGGVFAIVATETAVPVFVTDE